MVPLPQRDASHHAMTSGFDHHRLDVRSASLPDPVGKIYGELFRLAFSLPEVRERPSIPSLTDDPRGLQISEAVTLERLDVLSHAWDFDLEREIAHIHSDGSAHLHLPLDRIDEVRSKGWGEGHPWAGSRINTPELGLVRYSPWLALIDAPYTEEELEVVVRLIVESYNFVAGRSIDPLDVLNGTLAEPPSTSITCLSGTMLFYRRTASLLIHSPESSLPPRTAGGIASSGVLTSGPAGSAFCRTVIRVSWAVAEPTGTPRPAPIRSFKVASWRASTPTAVCTSPCHSTSPPRRYAPAGRGWEVSMHRAQ